MQKDKVAKKLYLHLSTQYTRTSETNESRSKYFLKEVINQKVLMSYIACESKIYT
jgi:hypothetical protein